MVSMLGPHRVTEGHIQGVLDDNGESGQLLQRQLCSIEETPRQLLTT